MTSNYLCVVAIVLPHLGSAGEAEETFFRVRVEVFVRSDSATSRSCEKYAKKLQRDRKGLEITIRDVLEDKNALTRAHHLIRKYKVKSALPLIHTCGRLHVGFADEKSTGPQVDEYLAFHAYTRPGCSHCTDSKLFLKTIKHRYPGIRFVIHDIVNNQRDRREWEAAARRHGILSPGVPMFCFGGQAKVGFISEQITGRWIETTLQKYCVKAVQQRPTTAPTGAMWFLPLHLLQHVEERGGENEEPAEDLDDLPPLEDLPDQPDEEVAAIPPRSPPTGIDLPIFGRLEFESLGLPLFTVLVGLVDGFNPCAMWVLLFLLSVLVNLKDRKKIVAVAGVFVLISGLAYFAFMAAWLNIFLIVGYLRWSQIVLGLLAVAIGSIHVKDFFALHRGISLSIPESAKPGLYARVRKIVTAEHLYGAIIGAVVLAVLVNVIELLCTAGLPAVYTQILTMQELPPWKNYAYLGLYNLAYMFDDALMVTLVVVTLGKRKLQEEQGRWLKLLSGLVVLLLGLTLLFKPEWIS